jgi:glycosyltransferase involved in cell wall biosynthesis
MIESRLKKVDEVITVCDYITSKIPETFPQLKGRCRTVHNGVDLDEFDVKRGDRAKKGSRVKRLLFVGRVSPEKGIHVLLDAFENVVESYPDVELKIVGPIERAPAEFIVALSDDAMTSNLSSFYGKTDYVDQLKSRLSTAAGERVRFTGTIPHSQLQEHLEQADCFLHPSVWGEPFPLAVLEALAAGVPVVASRIGGLPESIEDGISGLLVTPDNSGELADAILRLVQDEELQRSMSQAARERAEDAFSWNRVRDDLLSIYEDICSR